MARMPEFTPLYNATQKFIKDCLLSNGSLLWLGQNIWTTTNVDSVKRRIVDHPELGSGEFRDKLLTQMSGANPDEWRLLAEVFYVYYLPSSTVKLATKRSYIAWLAEQGGASIPSSDDEIWIPLAHGFTGTSYKYNLKYGQLWFLLMFAQKVKNERDAMLVLHSPERLQQLLDEVLESIETKSDRAYDMRHALLYLTFPDKYERIISTRDKERIIETFGYRVEGALSEDIDEALRQIRTVLRDVFRLDDREFDFYRELGSEWKPSEDDVLVDVGEVGAQSVTDAVMQSIREAFKYTRNVILYGPPGTGKTYLARLYGDELAKEAEPRTRMSLMQQHLERLTWPLVIALSFYHQGTNSHYSVHEITHQEVVRFWLSNVSTTRTPANTLWYYLQRHTAPDSPNVNVAQRTEPYLFDKDANSQWYLTSEGREYVEQTLSDQLAILASNQPSSDSQFVEWVTFHQSYSYEDFVEGLRPVVSDDYESGTKIEVQPGVFRRICARAAADPSNEYLLIIDEINRGNIAKIFGELITLIEDDKRHGEGTDGLIVTLPYSRDSFSVPDNLKIIGTMNTADRSIALLDVALRRRFAFIEVLPQAALLDGKVIDTDYGTINLRTLLENINKRIRHELDHNHQIGHSYLLRESLTEENDKSGALEYVWNRQIVPLLEEYFFARPEGLAHVLPTFFQESDEVTDTPRVPKLTGENLIVALSKLAQVDTSEEAL